jgi:Golgi apparatus protein 1
MKPDTAGGSEVVSSECSGHIKRVMHQRATNIRLMPEVELPCIADLGQHCLDKANGEGEEIECLQENYEALSPKCQEAIKDFSQLEGRDFDLNYHLANKCGAMATKFCKRELDEEDGERVIPCLISAKNDIEMDHLCADAIEHWQIMEMKDVTFSPAFAKICLSDIRNNCKDKKTKTDAIRCLSQSIVTDSTKVTLECRTQLKKELLKQSEDIKLMPELYKACAKDIKTYCAHVPSGGAQLEECLRKNHHKLQAKECKTLLFEEETAESQD